MPTPGSLAWIYDAGSDKDRPAIVLRETPNGRWLALLGRENPGHPPRMTISQNCRAGRRLGLSKPTNFFPKPAIVAPAAFRRECGTCPQDEFDEAMALVGFAKPVAAAAVSQTAPVLPASTATEGAEGEPDEGGEGAA